MEIFDLFWEKSWTSNLIITYNKMSSLFPARVAPPQPPSLFESYFYSNQNGFNRPFPTNGCGTIHLESVAPIWQSFRSITWLYRRRCSWDANFILCPSLDIWVSVFFLLPQSLFLSSKKFCNAIRTAPLLCSYLVTREERMPSIIQPCTGALLLAERLTLPWCLNIIAVLHWLDLSTIS